VHGAELAAEFFLNALRLTDGVSTDLFTARTGLPLDVVAAPLASARARGLMTADPDRLRPTPLGQRFLNELLALFEPD
jgi:oxygen-independent coproporphyrinogen-3 oxidase